MDSSDIESSVYTGLWTNWARGSIMGSTLTVHRSQGNLLIAFTASFIAFVSIRFWHIICVSLFRQYSTSNPRQVLHHQRQVVLRSSVASPASGLFGIAVLAWAWLRRSSNWFSLLRMLLPAAMLSLFTMAAFTVAGIFSSSIASTAGDVVLLASSEGRCGFTSQGQATTESELVDWSTEMASATDIASGYAKQCYSGGSSGIFGCKRYFQPRLPLYSNTSAACPFPDSGMCRTDTENILLDTGHLDLDHWLGLNTSPAHRSSVRYLQHCAPLKTDGMVSRYHDAHTNATLVRYHYGPYLASSAVDGQLQTVDYTYQVRDVDSQYQHFEDSGGGVSAQSDRSLGLAGIDSFVKGGQPGLCAGCFIPAETLRRPDGDTSIYFLSGNGVPFGESVPDEWYRITGKGPSDIFTSGEGNDTMAVKRPTYITSEAASPLGCVRQYQFCNRDKCGILGSVHDAAHDLADHLSLTKEEGVSWDKSPPASSLDAIMLWWIYTSIGEGRPENVPFFLGSGSLTTQKYLDSANSVLLPETGQIWHKDVTNWAEIFLASLQASFVNIPIGSTRPEAKTSRVVIPFSDGSNKLFCNSQKIRSTRYTSFNFFGLAFTYVVGCLIIAVSWSLEPLLAELHRRFRYREYEQLEWSTYAPLQLQRLAQEELGHGGRWSGAADDVPLVETDGINLASLDVRDPDHPVLSRKDPEKEKEDDPLMRSETCKGYNKR